MSGVSEDTSYSMNAAGNGTKNPVAFVSNKNKVMVGDTHSGKCLFLKVNYCGYKGSVHFVQFYGSFIHHFITIPSAGNIDVGTMQQHY